MTTIVISYRREDSKHITGRIFDRLEGHYGHDAVFMDIDNIPYGTDFRDHLESILTGCDILLAVVGPNWAAVSAAGEARIRDDEDWVRIEIATALSRGVPVIPLLIDNTPMPKARDLPDDLRGFAFRQAATIDTGLDFRAHMERLIKSMDRLLEIRASQQAQPETVAISEASPKLPGNTIQPPTEASTDAEPPTRAERREAPTKPPPTSATADDDGATVGEVRGVDAKGGGDNGNSPDGLARGGIDAPAILRRQKRIALIAVSGLLVALFLYAMLYPRVDRPTSFPIAGCLAQRTKIGKVRDSIVVLINSGADRADIDRTLSAASYKINRYVAYNAETTKEFRVLLQEVALSAPDILVACGPLASQAMTEARIAGLL